MKQLLDEPQRIRFFGWLGIVVVGIAAPDVLAVVILGSALETSGREGIVVQISAPLRLRV